MPEPSIMQTVCASCHTNVQGLTGAVVCRHHTRKILSMLPAASSVFSVFTAMSVISAEAPRSVANRRPSITLHILTSRSSAPYREGSIVSLTFTDGKRYNYLFIKISLTIWLVAQTVVSTHTHVQSA